MCVYTSSTVGLFPIRYFLCIMGVQTQLLEIRISLGGSALFHLFINLAALSRGARKKV